MRLSVKLSLRVVLALALLFAQAGALAHLYSHRLASTDPAGLAGDQSPACSECLSFAPLLTSAGGISSTFALCAPDADRPAAFERRESIHAPRHFAFRSRAPPPNLLNA